MKALVTGATGFIGNALASALVEAGWEVDVLIRPGSRTRLLQPDRFRIIEVDLVESTSLHPGMFHGDVVVHAAAVRNRWGTPSQVYYAVNVEATRNLLGTVAGYAQRFVYVSSVGVFGRPGTSGIDESFPVRMSTGNWDYHNTKSEGERTALSFSDQIEVVLVRPTITYGPGDADGMVTQLFNMIAHRRFVRIGRGSNHIHLTYISDLVQGLLLAMTHPATPGNTFILSGPTSIAMQELLALIESLVNVRLKKWYVPERLARLLGWANEGAVRWGRAAHLLPKRFTPYITRDKVENICAHRSFSSERATHMLGYEPKVGYPEGLGYTYEWIVADQPQPHPVSTSPMRSLG